MKKVGLLFITIIICSCVNQQGKNSLDQEIWNNLIGTWDYETGPESCIEYGWMSFKKNGKYSRTSDDCQIADDSFGEHYYGWYVANQHICFVETKKHLGHAKKFGFVKDHCKWKVVEFTNEKIKIHSFWYWHKDEEPVVFHFNREKLP